MTVERIHPKAPVMLIFIAIFTCLPSCINLSNIKYIKFKRHDSGYSYIIVICNIYIDENGNKHILFEMESGVV